MKLSELIEALEQQRKFRPREDPDIVIKCANPSVGGSSVTKIYHGFDWDTGRLFLVTEERLCKAVEVTTAKIEEEAKIYAEYQHEKLGFEYPKQRKTSWLYGFVDGAKWGITKLAEKNKLSDPSTTGTVIAKPNE